jgi:23S rRNA (guanosine2251-2'-O)-methyltransferase
MSEILYGRRPVLEALKSGVRPVLKVYMMKGGQDDVLSQIEAYVNAHGIPNYYETRHKLDVLAACDKHQGVVAVLESRKYAELSDLMEAARAKDEPLFAVLLDEIEDPQNLGAILRSADAAGAHGVVIPKNRAAEVTPTVVKASAGAAEHVLTVKVTNLNDAIQKLKDEGAWVYGADTQGERPFYEADFKRPCVIVIGNEGKGLRRLVKENCDERVSIPMYGKVASLNASVSAAMLLFEVVRQRQWKTGTSSPDPYSQSSTNYYTSSPPSYPGISAPGIPMGIPPPEQRNFFRGGPDPAFETPTEGPPEKIKEGPDSQSDEPGTSKGGHFHW